MAVIPDEVWAEEVLLAASERFQTGTNLNAWLRRIIRLSEEESRTATPHCRRHRLTAVLRGYCQSSVLTGISLCSVKSSLHRARCRLRAELGSYGHLIACWRLRSGSFGWASVRIWWDPTRQSGGGAVPAWPGAHRAPDRCRTARPRALACQHVSADSGHPLRFAQHGEDPSAADLPQTRGDLALTGPAAGCRPAAALNHPRLGDELIRLPGQHQGVRPERSALAHPGRRLGQIT
jgi:hypothetical protein